MSKQPEKIPALKTQTAVDGNTFAGNSTIEEINQTQDQSKHNVIDNRYGTIGAGAIVANELAIYTGDPPEVRQKKLEQAKSLIAEEIFTNINNMDARLSLVGTALEDDNFDQRLRDVRNKVAPSLNEIFDLGYSTLMSQQKISSLREKFTSLPLYEVRAPLIQVLIDSNADAETVREFYSSLIEVQNVSESLFYDLSTAQELSTTAAQSSRKLKVTAHYKKRVKLAVERLSNRSQIAYLSGLIVLDSLKISLPNAQNRLSSLKHLEPRQLITRGEAIQLLTAQLQEAKRILAERTVILEEGKNLRDAALDEYEKLNKKLVIQPSDPWNVVGGKAISLRQLGRTTERMF
jgi:hypothetical protein